MQACLYILPPSAQSCQVLGGTFSVALQAHSYAPNDVSTSLSTWLQTAYISTLPDAFPLHGTDVHEHHILYTSSCLNNLANACSVNPDLPEKKKQKKKGRVAPLQHCVVNGWQLTAASLCWSLHLCACLGLSP